MQVLGIKGPKWHCVCIYGSQGVGEDKEEGREYIESNLKFSALRQEKKSKFTVDKKTEATGRQHLYYLMSNKAFNNKDKSQSTRISNSCILTGALQSSFIPNISALNNKDFTFELLNYIIAPF